MAILMSALVGLLALVSGLLVRALAVLAVLGLLALIVLPVVVAAYWLNLVYDGIVGIRRLGEFSWRRDSYYTPGHLWLRPMRAQTVRVGVDDIGQRVLPGVASIALAEPGTRVDRGQPIADIQCGHGHVVLRSPVDGTIAGANPRLARTPALLNRDSYRRAWLVEIDARDSRLDTWLSGGRARTWFVNEGRRLTGAFEQAFGMEAADGGELIRSPATLSDDQWRAVSAAFLEPSAYADPAGGHTPLAPALIAAKRERQG